MNPYYEYEHRVTFAETNVVGNVYFTAHLTWQGACRELFLADRAPGVLQRLREDLALVTVSCSCDYVTELHALDRISVRMSLAGIEDNRITMAFGYYRTGAGPALLAARGRQTIACMTRTPDGLHPTEVPEEFAEALRPYASQ
ncbi:acyl-CoA thioesterase [Actinomadura geliboluensis]|uniref:Acyl-CoA thioesterase n=1 Tax=Actinomadura geliboluensis TaxID=882440 RepID=A0A5S4H6H8_9ACTN|nr:acyl-CoA thioesterase [Actinomadura geliboluensis]TMR40686.1 acyl-CoA thioesterase [Actinomadura geliboluensis]